MTSTTRTRARRGEGERLRAEILAAAERLLTTRGSAEAVSIRAIAQEVRVTAPSIYLHFPDKDALMFEICASKFAELDARLGEVEAAVPDPVERLRAMGREFLRFAFEHPERYRVLFLERPAYIPRDVDANDLPGLRAYRRLVDTVRAAVETGAFRPVDPLLAATTLYSALHGVVALLIVAGDVPAFPWPDREELEEHVLGTILRGHAARDDQE